MTIAVKVNDKWHRWNGRIGDVVHSIHDVEMLWSNEDIEAAGLKRVLSPHPIPEGKMPVGEPYIVDEEGEPRFQFDLVDMEGYGDSH